jgi:hypothetical protein
MIPLTAKANARAGPTHGFFQNGLLGSKIFASQGTAKPTITPPTIVTSHGLFTELSPLSDTAAQPGRISSPASRAPPQHHAGATDHTNTGSRFPAVLT